ncbi:MAG TPA: hypothetical protein VF600_07595 [Abditibacteriaceae bacterium]|jgi:hypothetical protein
MRTPRLITRSNWKQRAVAVSLVPLFVPVFALSTATVAPHAAYAQSENVQPATPPEVDLSSAFAAWGLGLKSQRRRDTCAVFTITGALEYGLARSLDDGVRLSEEYLNWAANDVGDEWRDGASFAELQRGFSKWGIAEDADMLYQRVYNASFVPSENAMNAARQVWEMKPKWNWLARDSTTGLTSAHIAAIKRVLAHGWPVAAGGEHCMLIVAYSDDDSQPGGGTFVARDYATSRNRRMTYAETQRRFDSLLWIQFPQQVQE